MQMFPFDIYKFWYFLNLFRIFWVIKKRDILTKEFYSTE